MNKEEIKTCCKCGLPKLLDEFPKTTCQERRRNKCKSCYALERDAWRLNNLERVKERGKYWNERNPEKVKESKRKYRQNHKEKIALSQQKYCLEHSDWIKSKKNAITAAFSKKVVLFMGGKCEICGLETDYYEVYDCHYKNPEEKEYKVSALRHKDWDAVVVPELLKCALVCHNCHKSLTSQIARSNPIRSHQSRYNDKRNDSYKQRCIGYIGGGCQICGLITEDNNIYDFHHTDPSTKISGIAKLISADWITIVQPELDKCALLCGNCHASVHVGRYNDVILIPGRRDFSKSENFFLDNSNNNSYIHDIGRGENRLGVYTASF
jgi:hypothetical protein